MIRSFYTMVFGLCLVFFPSILSANNIRVSNVSTLQQSTLEQTVLVAFDISWDNSWRNDHNWDAAWVFVKYRAPGSNNWQHATLSNDIADHQNVPDSVIMPVPDGAGVFLFSENAYTGSVAHTGSRLLWNYGADGHDFSRGDLVEVAVHAIEMVYVPEGEFEVGYGIAARQSFTEGGWLQGEDPTSYRITGEGSLMIENTAGNLWATGNIGSAGELPAAFPKGYAGFYCMKYSISQGQYAAFLNKLSSDQADNRYSGQYGNSRHTIAFDAVYERFTVDAPDRACNYLSWADGTAYAAWAGLRPMTELEYEKVCRGFSDPVRNEFAWGTTGYTGQTGHQGVDGSGTETALPAHANVNLIWSFGGPVRSGIYAQPDADRYSSGASYWGIMELSGNVWEQPVSVGHNTGRAFTGLHGEGSLTAAGDADVAGWPGTNAHGAGCRGVSTHTNDSHMPVAARYDAARSTLAASRHAYGGWRGVRTAP